MSTLTIAGNLTRDPELRNVSGGRTVVSFSVAENRRWADKSGATQEAVTYLDVTAWGTMADHVAKSPPAKTRTTWTEHQHRAPVSGPPGRSRGFKPNGAINRLRSTLGRQVGVRSVFRTCGTP